MKRSKPFSDVSRLMVVVLLFWLYQPGLRAEEADGASVEGATSEEKIAPSDDSSPQVAAATPDNSTVSLAGLLILFNQQQKQIDEQSQRLDEQSKQIKEQQVMITTLLTSQKESTREAEQYRKTIVKQGDDIDNQRKTIQSTLAQVDELAQSKAEELSQDEVDLRARLETLESSIRTSRDSARTAFDEDSFPNSLSIPGTNAAMKMGGFVKMNIVETFDPLGSTDRFIAGTIPVPQESHAARSTMNVSQSRLNWDLRDRTSMGVMRAYVEGDFAGDSDTFRLRHAYGQFRSFLAGKTWSSFMDPDASPEELDFEGINGRVNVRQAQIRYFPNIGQDWNFVVSLEEPQAEVTDGQARSQWPDVLFSARKTWFERWHVKSSAVIRQLTATWDDDTTGDTESKETAYGISISGKTKTQFLNDLGLNNFMFQLNVGKGIGHYINDLDTIDGQDAAFSPTGDLETLPVLAGYVAYQHWWNEKMRSTLNLSWVGIDNLDFQPDEAYKSTLRGALNFIWSPVSRIDIGGEIIWGQRKNKDNQKADASQIQLSTKYRF